MKDFSDNNLQAVMSFLESQNINREMLLHSLIVAFKNREETKNQPIPRYQETFPYKFMPSVTMRKAKNVCNGEKPCMQV